MESPNLILLLLFTWFNLVDFSFYLNNTTFLERIVSLLEERVILFYLRETFFLCRNFGSLMKNYAVLKQESDLQLQTVGADSILF